MRSFLISLVALGCGPQHTTASCPVDLDHAPRGHCTLGTHCPVGDGVCDCDGYHGGIDPGPGDFSHWQCGRTRHRTDRCPDDLAAGRPCNAETGPEHCGAVEGQPCGPMFTCTNGKWSAAQDSCAAIP